MGFFNKIKRVFSCYAAVAVVATGFVLGATDSHAGEIVNVEYIHKYIKQKWNLDIPYSPKLGSVREAANMKYLLTLVDIANYKLNGEYTTHYGDDEKYATRAAADTVATIKAVDTLVKENIKYEFFFTPETTNKAYSFQISAAGKYYIDWGDGQKETIEKPAVGQQIISHTYADAANTHEISLGGKATAYDDTVAAVSFDSASDRRINAVRGCLGCVFATLSDGAQPLFMSTFAYNGNLKQIPADLFKGVKGEPIKNMFNFTFYNSGLTEIPENLFAGIQGAPASSMFRGTFEDCTGLTSIPEKLFAGIQGAPASSMFDDTFKGCSGLKSIPENLFAGITGAPVMNMFFGTFNGCNGLTSIPEKLFAGIQGAPAERMFVNTFWGCSGLKEIPEKLFAGILGAPAGQMFWSTFSDCSELTSIPENLFAGIKGVPAEQMFINTFSGCSGLKEIPENLFVGIKGAPAQRMFEATFDGCSGLQSIPENLFAGIQGTPAFYMFDMTFRSCSGLTEIPEKLFAGIKGAPAGGCFTETFKGCSRLKEIPEKLFAGIRGAPASTMFTETFNGCTGLTSIPANLFAGIETGGEYQVAMFNQTFYNCKNLTGYSPKINGQYLYEIWPSVSNQQTYTNDKGLTDYDCIPTAWGGAGTKQPGQCEPEPEYSFFFTPETDGRTFNFILGAAGEFYIDWGDGQKETIEKDDIGHRVISHTYADAANTHEIKLGGKATKYDTKEYDMMSDEMPISTIMFVNESAWQGDDFDSTYRIKAMRGCLGCVFSTLPDGGQPRFSGTFVANTALTGAIPENLFDGVKGAPISFMFENTFSYCVGLTSIPKNLFAGIKGAPAMFMFSGTFAGCDGLKAIPENLFAGIKGAPAEMMFGMTFDECSGLTGSIPEGLFAGIKGAPAAGMFEYTFAECSGLTSIPENLFAGIQGAPAVSMFDKTFANCTSLTGTSPKINGLFLYEIWPDAHWPYTYKNATNLTDYDCIPEEWGGAGRLEPGNCQAAPENAEYSFFFSPEDTGTSYRFSISAAGKFYIDWGDGQTETIKKTNTYIQSVSHTFADGRDANEHEIKLGGKATEYSTSSTTAAVSFTSGKLRKMSGCLGCVFSTITDTAVDADARQPRFHNTFQNNDFLRGEIPEDLFKGVTGAPVSNMFYGTFWGCRGLTGGIPEKLFAGIQGAPASSMFSNTFNGCSGLKEIPENLFATIQGAPASEMFQGTFSNCIGLTEIPANLFATIQGAPAQRMFSSTFLDCSKLTSIPENLFAGIETGGAYQTAMFASTFSGCTSLTGPSAKIGGKYLYEIWPDASGQNTYANDTQLSDYSQIPYGWK